MTTGESDPHAEGMSHLVRPAVIVTLFGLAGPVINFFTQVVISAVFGATAQMDAFLAAVALPQYVITVLMGTLGFVFIPVFIQRTAAHRDEEAWTLASTVFNLCLIVLGVLAAVGIAFTEPLLRVSAPGLGEEALKLAVVAARISWPIILAAGVTALLTGIYQARQRFIWAAAAVFISAAFNLVLVLTLAKPLGVKGLAVAASVSAIFQAVLLLPILFGGRYRPVMDLRSSGIRQLLFLLTPLILANLFGKSTTLVERYFASNLAVGSISQLGYASKLLMMFIVLISSGINTVVFPRLALNSTLTDLSEFKKTISVSMKMMWVLIAPAITVGAVVALPLVTVVFQRGKFTAADALSVSAVLRIYLCSLFGACLCGITGRAFYALKDTMAIAVIGLLESVAYVIYTALLAKRFGIAGVAWGFVIYCTGSLLWQFAVLRFKLKGSGGRGLVVSFSRTAGAAMLAGGVSWAGLAAGGNAWTQLLCAGAAGGAAYVVTLKLFRSEEAALIWRHGAAYARRTISGSSSN